TSRRSLSPRSPLNHRILRQSRRLPPSLQLSGSCCCSFSSEVLCIDHCFNRDCFSVIWRTDASKNGGFGWCIHGMDEAHDSQSSSRVLYVVSTLAAEALTLQVVLPSASSAGFSKLQVISDSIVLFSALHSEMDLNEIAGCLLTNLATLFSPLSFNLYQCATLCLAVASAMCLLYIKWVEFNPNFTQPNMDLVDQFKTSLPNDSLALANNDSTQWSVGTATSVRAKFFVLNEKRTIREIIDSTLVYKLNSPF
ncbi:unnamed protein product, partial [Brassica napus]